VTAEVYVENRDHRLRAGTIVTADLRLARGGTYPVVPAQAVFALAGEQHVYRLDDDGKIHDTKLTLGTEKDGTVQVLSGLKAGDRILRDGSRSIADGTQYEGVPGAKPIEKEGGEKEKEGGDKEKKPAENDEKSNKPAEKGA